MIELNQIYNEDCLIGMQRVPDASVQLIYADLPFGTTQCAWDSVIPFAPLWEHYERIIKPNGAIVLFASQPFTSALVMSNLRLFRYEWIWEKDRASGHLDCNRKPMKSHESILVFSKKRSLYNPQMDFDRPMSKRSGNKKTTPEVYGKHSPTNWDGSTTRYPRSVMRHNTVNSAHKQTHPTQKPVSLACYFIRTYTNAGDLVLDNVSGSGTTAIACIDEGRKFICFEKDEKHWRNSIDRVANHRAKAALLF